MRWTDALRSVVALAALAGTPNAQPAPQPLSLLDVPFISQTEALCGGAAAAMVLRYWGERGIDAESFAHLVDSSAAGIRTDALVEELRTRGWNATGLTGSGDRIARELAQGRPVLTLIEDRPGAYHYIVVVAATDRALVFHDPARAPLRVMSQGEFERRWSAAARWMAIVLPRDPQPVDVDAGDPAGTPANACEALVAEGVERAQDNDLAGAERSLTRALSCPGPAAMRELAGVRLLQRRWPDVSELAAAALAADPRDEHAWRLLGTSRFVQNDPRGALEAWNHVGEPRIDLLAVSGLVRTRQRSVEQLMGARRDATLTPDGFGRASRRLDELPSAFSTRLEYVPVPSGLAELRATVNERPMLPSDVWSYAAIGLKAGANRELEASTGSLTGGGERLTAAWRFWPERPRLGLRVDSPAPWGGTWTVQGFAARETFNRAGMPRADRSGGDMAISNWVSSVVRVTLRGGVARWKQIGAHGTAGGAIRLVTSDDRIEARAAADVWKGPRGFGRVDGRVLARSSVARSGGVFLVRGGAGAAFSEVPPDLWFGGDTGHVSDLVLRAHPLLDDGRLVTAQIGRRIVHASVEAQRWWGLSIARVGAAVFVDAARVDGRLDPGARGDVDAGAGARLAIPGLRGTFRADLARGLRDGATTLSFVYEP